MKVCVQSIWHLGSVTAVACLASLGNSAVGFRFRSWQGSGGITKGSISFTADAEDAVKGIDVLMVATHGFQTCPLLR